MAAIKTMENIQCRNRAAAGLCSGSLFEESEGQKRRLRWAQGVVMLLAKKRENGRTPSLAISCLTNSGVRWSATTFRAHRKIGV